MGRGGVIDCDRLGLLSDGDLLAGRSSRQDLCHDGSLCGGHGVSGLRDDQCGWLVKDSLGFTRSFVSMSCISKLGSSLPNGNSLALSACLVCSNGMINCVSLSGQSRIDSYFFARRGGGKDLCDTLGGRHLGHGRALRGGDRLLSLSDNQSSRLLEYSLGRANCDSLALCAGDLGRDRVVLSDSLAGKSGVDGDLLAGRSGGDDLGNMLDWRHSGVRLGDGLLDSLPDSGRIRSLDGLGGAIFLLGDGSMACADT